MEASGAQLPAAGDVLGKYRIVRLLGQGGMGAVFEAVHARLGQPVAIKVLLPRFLDKPEVIGRFEREARAASQIRGVNVARVIDVDVSGTGTPYMVMEFLEGHDVAHELSLRKTLPCEEAVDIVLQACAGMAGAHALGIIHRDLKPSNLFLCEEGGGRVVKVLDFGISKITNETDSAVTATEMTIGTPLYMSPEQIRSAKHVDARADIWALGVILYELLAGRPPFTGGSTAVAAAIVADDVEPLRNLRPDVPEALERAVLRALEKRADKRFPDVGSLATALLPFASAAARGRALSESGQFSRITALDVQRIAVEAPPTIPSADAATMLAPREAVTAAPWTAAEPFEPRRRSKRVALIAASSFALCALAGYVLFARPTLQPTPPATATATAPATAAASVSTVADIAAPIPPPSSSPSPAPSASPAPIATAPTPRSSKPSGKPTAPVAKPAEPMPTENPVKL